MPEEILRINGKPISDQVYTQEESGLIINNFACSICWSHLNGYFLPGRKTEILCAKHPNEHRGYHSNYFIQKEKSNDLVDAIEVKALLRKIGIIDNPYLNKSAEELIREMGFEPKGERQCQSKD